MHIMHSKAMIPVSKILEIYRYTEDTCDILYRQYHRLTRTEHISILG